MYKAWYCTNPTFRSNPLLTSNNLTATHVMVREVAASDLDSVYTQMQGEIWSPNGEARQLIKSLGLSHTSMSVGDVIETPDGKFHEVDSIGFREIA